MIADVQLGSGGPLQPEGVGWLLAPPLAPVNDSLSHVTCMKTCTVVPASAAYLAHETTVTVFYFNTSLG